MLTGIAALLGIDQVPGLDKQWTTLLCFGIYVAALAAGFLGFFSMLGCGVKEVGRLRVGGRLLPKYVLPAICIPLYLAPWALLLALWMFTR